MSLVERAEVAGSVGTPDEPAVLETDCSCCLHHMTSYHLKLLETVSLRWRGGKADENINATLKRALSYATEQVTVSPSLPECVCLSCLCTPTISSHLSSLTVQPNKVGHLIHSGFYVTDGVFLRNDVTLRILEDQLRNLFYECINCSCDASLLCC